MTRPFQVWDVSPTIQAGQEAVDRGDFDVADVMAARVQDVFAECLADIEQAVLAFYGLTDDAHRARN